jgi:CRISPR-associated protein Cmr6
LKLLGAEVFRCKTTGPLTLHLARASALENAGICLHPLYGFTYFPGSGLKGMARSFAETVWFPAQFAAGSDGQPAGAVEEHKATEAWAKIEQVFGRAPFSDNLEKGATKPWKARCVPDHSREDSAHSGSIVFHDAWPEQWPRLYMDILNNHHSGYYQGKDAPGDWENPIPVYFLAVVPEQVFSFTVYKRTSQIDGSLVALAKEWLLGGLCHLGAGRRPPQAMGISCPSKASCHRSSLQRVRRSKLRSNWLRPLSLPAPGSRKRTAIFARPLFAVCSAGGGEPCTPDSWTFPRWVRSKQPSGVT